DRAVDDVRLDRLAGLVAKATRLENTWAKVFDNDVRFGDKPAQRFSAKFRGPVERNGFLASIVADKVRRVAAKARVVAVIAHHVAFTRPLDLDDIRAK